MGVIGNFTTGVRHAVEPTATFGTSVAADRYNARDEYRRSYTDDQRAWAGAGAGLGTALTGIGAYKVATKGIPALREAGGAKRVGAMLGATAFLAATGAAHGRQLEWITKDDGNLGAVGSAAGIIGGGMAGVAIANRMAGHGGRAGRIVGALAGGIGAAAGAVAMHAAGSSVKVGDGHIGEEHVVPARTDATTRDRIHNFTQSAAAHFVETGPLSYSISFGNAWHKDAREQVDSTKSDRGGAQLGDFGATALAGGAALLSAKRLAGTMQVLRSGDAEQISAHMANRYSSSIAQMAERIRPMSQGKAMAVADTAVLIGVMSAMNYPVREFVQDVRESHKQFDPSTPVAAGASLAGAAGGFAVGRKLAAGMGKYSPLVMAGATLAGGAAGFGMSAAMGDVKTAGLGAAAGAALGAGAGAVFRGATAKQGALVGGALGAMVSTTIATPGATKPAPSAPGDVIMPYPGPGSEAPNAEPISA